MVWQSTPWADPLLFSTVMSATLAVFGLLYVALVRRDRRVVAFATLMVAAAVWTLGYSFQFASETLVLKRDWAAVAMAGEAVVPVAWFTFAAAYTRRDEWLRPRRVVALWTVPLVTVALAATNGAHGLVWAASRLVSAPDGAYLILERTGGPWLLVHGGYSFLVAFAGVAVLVGMIERSRRVYRGQAAVLFTGIAVPAAATLASLAGVGPARVVDLTAPSITVLGVAFAAAIFQYRLFDLVPVARASVVENMGEGYVLLDEAGDVVDLNAAARSLLDGDDGRLVGRRARSVFDADLDVLDAFDGGTATETVATGSGDDRRSLELTVSAVEADRVAGRLLGVRDVTDRMRLERRFQTLIEASSDVVLVLDETGLIEYASPSVQRVLGYDPDDLAGRIPFDALTVDDASEDREAREADEAAAVDGDGGESEASGATTDTEGGRSAAVETWRRVLEGSEADPTTSTTNRFEGRVATADGNERTIEVIARYLIDDPAVEGIVLNARDVTERKRRELELERTNERLERFASLVSHDLRNPLQVAIGRLDLAMQTGDADSLETVRRQHERMEEMIDDLLSMARDGRAVEDPGPVEVGELARRAWASVKTGDATLVVDASMRVVADDSRLSNLFENLFRNAVEHGSTTPQPAAEDAVEHAAEGGLSDLTVTVSMLPDGFAVADDGAGIPEDHRDRVLESGHTTESGNTGFGLAIVDDIATAHGWTTRVTESDAGGARFEFHGVELANESDATDGGANGDGTDVPDETAGRTVSLGTDGEGGE